MNAKPLKMWIGNFDGSREGLVIAATKAQALKVVGGGRKNFEDYWTLQPAVDPAFTPEVLYTRLMRHPKATWQQGRCPL